MSLGQSLQVALLGFCTVFFMLCLLWGVISILTRVVSSIQKKAVKEEPATTAPVVTEDPTGPYGGEVKLVGIDEKSAACVMAIISDQTQIPLNQLIFKSIKAVDEE